MRASLASPCGFGRACRVLPAAILYLVTALAPAAAQDFSAQPQDAARVRPALQSRRITQPPIIDGVLDDDAWREGPVDAGDWLSYNPLYGTAIPQKTKVWIGHDTNYLYFAF